MKLKLKNNKAYLLVFCCLLCITFVTTYLLNRRDPNNPQILFLGDSLTAGFHFSIARAYPNIIQKILDQNEIKYNVINGGVVGDTSEAGYLRLPKLLNTKTKIVFICLGTNDFIKNIDNKVTLSFLEKIILKIKNFNSKIKIVLADPGLIQFSSDKIKSIYSELSTKHNLKYFPGLLIGFSGNRDLMKDKVHPTAKGHRIIAQNVWEVLKPLTHY